MMSIRQKIFEAMKKERMINRQKIKDLNRNQFNICRNQTLEDVQIQLKTVLPEDQSCYVDQQYLTIIKSCLNLKSELTPNTAASIIKRSSNIVDLYRVVLWVGTSMKKRRNRAYFLQLLGVGILHNLSQMIILINHPFLQLRALSSILTAIKFFTSSQKRGLLNKTQIPLSRLKIILESNVPEIVQKGIQVFSHLMINLQLNSTLDDLPVLNLLKIIAENSKSNYLEFVIESLRKFSFRYLALNIKFQSLFFQFLSQVVDMLEEKPISRGSIDELISWFIKSSIIQRVCKSKIKQSYLSIFFKKIHDIDFRSSYFSVKIWSNLVKSFASTKTELLFVWNSLDKLQRGLELSNSLEDSMDLFEVYRVLIYYYIESKADLLMNRPKIIEKLAAIAHLTTQDKYQQHLNIVFFRIFRAYPHCEISKVILNFDLLKNVVQLCLRPNLAKNRAMVLNMLKSLLQTLKTTSQYKSQYEKISSYMAEEGLLDGILSVVGTSLFADFYIEMKKENEMLSQKQANQKKADKNTMLSREGSELETQQHKINYLIV